MQHTPALSIPFLLAAFGAALFFHGTQDVLYAPLIAMLASFGILTIIPGVKNGWSLSRSFTAISVGVYWLFLFVALSWSQTPYVSFYFFLIFSILPFVFFALTCTREPERICRLAVLCIFVAISLLALWALLQFLFLFSQYGERIRHPFLDPNSMAGLLNPGLILALALFMMAQGRRAVTATGILYAVFLMALAATQSRGGLIAAVVAALVFLPFAAKPLKDHVRRICAAVSIGFAAPFAVWFYDMQFHHRPTMKDVFGGDIGSMTDRGALWRSTWNMIRDHFWGGTGLASFSYFYPSYRFSIDRSDGYFAHMDPLQFAAEMGVFAPVLFYIVLIAILIRTIRAVRAVDSILRLHIMAPFCAMLAVLLHTHLNYHLYMPAILIPLGVMLAYWYVMTERALDDSRTTIAKSPRVRYAVFAALTLLSLMAAMWSVRTVVAVHYLTAAETALAASDIDTARVAVEKAARWAPASKPQIPQYESRWRRQKLQMEGRVLTPEQRMALYTEALAALDRMERLQPSLTLAHTARAKLYYAAQGYGLISDGNEKAMVELRAALEKNPLDIDARNSLAQIHIQAGNSRAALAVMEDGLKWPRPKGQADLDYLATTAQLYRQMGDERKFEILIEEARKRAKSYGLLQNPR